MDQAIADDWIDALPLAKLEESGKVLVRHGKRQILVVKTPKGIAAFPNRCPHEGYPLSDGILTDGCVLTCNWHNWKFDLASGETLVGGDRLVRYPVRLASGRVWLDLTPPDPARHAADILAGLDSALADNDAQRLVRECARLVRLGADPVDAVRRAVAWLAPRLEFGMTHALAGAPDWLVLHDAAGRDDDERLAALGEILGHIADDASDVPAFPFPEGVAPWDATAYLEAIEREDERSALALVRGALASDVRARDLEGVLVEAALAHYADFGHSLIYAVKSVALAERLGPSSEEPILSLLTRSLVYAAREDLLPEFRDYARRLGEWARADFPKAPLEAKALRGLSAKSAMALVASWAAVHPPEAIFAVLVEAAAWILLHVDPHVLTRTDAKLADNVGWLDFTHALTFAEAGARATDMRADLWPRLLLQLACFVGRNNAYADAGFDGAPHEVADVPAFFSRETTALFDHGRDRFIISVHLIKTLMAARALGARLPAQAPILAAALNRLVHAPMKGRHVLRTARQMRELVEAE